MDLFSSIPTSLGIKARSLAYTPFFKQSFDFRIHGDVHINGIKSISLGKNFVVLWNSALFAKDGQILIGDNVWLGINNEINAFGCEIRIGNDCMFGSNVVLVGRNHLTARRDTPIHLQGHDENKKGIIIEEDVWVGSNVVILPGVVVGKGAVLGAGSVVTKEVPSYTIVAGAPARVLRER